MQTRIPPPVIALITGLLIWLAGRIWPEPGFPEPGFSGYVYTGVAALLALCGAALDLKALGAFKRARTTFTPLRPEKASSLVTSGLYRFSRNPMYLGLLLILTGWALYLGHASGFIPLIFFVLYMNQFQIKPEERAMEKLFGADYQAYKAKVRRWL